MLGGNALAADVLIGIHQRMTKLEQENMGLRYKITQVEFTQDADFFFACMNLRAFRPESTVEEDDAVCREITASRRDWLFNPQKD